MLVSSHVAFESYGSAIYTACLYDLSLSRNLSALSSNFHTGCIASNDAHSVIVV